jgi:hypothetical protein
MHGVGKTPPKVYSAYAQVYNRDVLFGWPMFPLSDVTDGERNGGSPAEHYSWFESGTEVAKDSRHSYRRRRSLGAGGSDRLGHFPVPTGIRKILVPERRIQLSPSGRLKRKLLSEKNYR